jgi:hypothetical protein
MVRGNSVKKFPFRIETLLSQFFHEAFHVLERITNDNSRE